MKLFPAVTAVAAIALTGCAAVRGGAVASCEAVTSGTLPAGTGLEPMAGRFVLTLVATGGPARGSTAAGYLTLRQAPTGTPGPAPGARTALIGTTDVPLESVGALRLGDTGAEDPMAPGVAVYEQRSAASVPTVTARVGSHTTAAPTPGLQQIEGAYTVLFVRRIRQEGFAGGWQSGDGTMGGGAQGHFCASRIG